MHILMIGMDTSILTQAIGNARARHEIYAQQAGRISMVICNRRANGSALQSYESAYVSARPTQSRSYIHYLIDGYRAGLRFHAEHPADLITSQDPFLTALIGLMLRHHLHIPLIVQDHSSLLDNPYFAAEHPRNRFLQWLARRTVRRADAVRVVNRQERLACLRHGVDRVCVIPVAPNLERFLQPTVEQAIWREKLALNADAPVVLWVGRVVPVKNMPVLLDAFAGVHAQMPFAQFVIAGDVRRTDIPARVESLGLSGSVRLPGTVAHADLPALYQSATIYAHSSNYEGFGLVLAEAAASGLPVVSTTTAGAQEIVTESTGKLVPIGDSVALASAILDLLRHPTTAAALGQRARAHVQTTFDEKQLMSQWVEMWRAVANKERGGETPCAS